VIVDVQATRAIRQAEVGAAKTMIGRTEERFGLKPKRLAADTAYGSAATLNWIVNEKRIASHIPVIEKRSLSKVKSCRLNEPSYARKASFCTREDDVGPTTISPPFAESAKVVTPCSISINRQHDAGG